jgi:glycosyltransferase involved in cell wall biosynthesis
MRGLILHEGFMAQHVHKIPLCTALPSAETLQPPADPHTSFYAARLIPEKGIHLVLEAIKSLPRTRLVVAGAGPERVRLENLADEWALLSRVTFTGWLDPTAVASHIVQAAVVVVSSIWPEPFGLVGIEAMARARPVVAFDVGGVRGWLLPGKTGLLAPSGDVPALASAVGSLLNDPRRGQLLGAHGRASAEERFSPERFLKDLIAVGMAVARR